MALDCILAVRLSAAFDCLTPATTGTSRDPKTPGECHLYLAEGCHLYIALTVKCVHQIQMSLFLPFRNVTHRWLGRAAGGRGAQRSAAHDRRPIDRSPQPHPLSTERASARSARRAAQPTLKKRASR